MVQAYVRDVKSSVSRPEKELKAFGKVNVKPGATENVVLDFDKSAFAYYNPDTKLWTVEPGRFEILIGNASDNITAKVPVDVKETITWSDAVK